MHHLECGGARQQCLDRLSRADGSCQHLLHLLADRAVSSPRSWLRRVKGKRGMAPLGDLPNLGTGLFDGLTLADQLP